MSATEVAVIPRSGWGANEALRKQSPLFAPVSQIFIHHTATPNGAAPVPTIQQIYAEHLAQGWNDIGYSFLIDADGLIYEGRHTRDFPPSGTPDGQDSTGMGVVGAQVLGHDVGSVGIALLGTFTSASPTSAAMASLLALAAWLTDQYGLDPLGTTGQGEPVLAGHRDANATACPGDDLYGQLDSVRQAVASAIAAGSTNGMVAAPTCTIVIPGSVSNIPSPVVSGRVTRSAARVRVTFSGSGLAAPQVASVAPALGAFSLGASAFGPPLAPGSYAVSATALDAAGNASAPTQVTGSLQVVNAALPRGYWVLDRPGGVYPYGAAKWLGSTAQISLNSPVVAMDAQPDGDGYWLVASDGGIFAFGSAKFFGSTGGIKLNKPIVGICSTLTGNGYRLVASDGGMFCFGDAEFYGSTGSIRLNKPIVGMAATPTGRGYWLVASDGGMFAFGDAGFFGSTGSIRLSRPIVGMTPTPTGRGYWLVASDGGLFAFGDAGYFGSVPGLGLVDLDIAGMAVTTSGQGYYILNGSGRIYSFGDAPLYGSPLTSGVSLGAIGLTVLS